MMLFDIWYFLDRGSGHYTCLRSHATVMVHVLNLDKHCLTYSASKRFKHAYRSCSLSSFSLFAIGFQVVTHFTFLGQRSKSVSTVCFPVCRQATQVCIRVYSLVVRQFSWTFRTTMSFSITKLL